MRVKSGIWSVLFMLVMSTSAVLAKEYHVSVNGSDGNDGSESKPFKTISAGAAIAQPGDVITVHAGTYREAINPPRGGTSGEKRIVYQAAQGEKVVIKGSEAIKGWEKVQADTWQVTIANEFFGKFNPYADLIHGDWFYAKDREHHTGAVYLNGHWLSEAAKPDDVQKPAGDSPLWFAQVGAKNTTIQAQFKGVNPNESDVEINVRRAVFYPEKTGVNYITVRGFVMRHAATPWAPPTAEQIGLIGTNWSKGWIIENNDISYSVCVGVTLGKYGDQWDNTSQDTAEGYVETINRAVKNGWSKENIGHHIVRDNHISHCEQAGIVGSLGAIFSRITGNEIHDIHVRELFTGAEMAGIKIHASIDMLIQNNYIHHSKLGIWLDWMAQGVRVTSNLLHDNLSMDVLMEVDHGPYVIDNNMFLSETTLLDASEGGCFSHNLIGGTISVVPQDRLTPYHKEHSTEVAGLSSTRCGDNRFYNNMFVGGSGLVVYKDAGLPMFVDGNVYLKGAKAYPGEKNNVEMADFDPNSKVVEKDGAVYLHMTLPKVKVDWKRQLVTTELLGKATVPQLPFENYDGTSLRLDMDYFGKERNNQNPSAGAIENPGCGRVIYKVR